MPAANVVDKALFDALAAQRDMLFEQVQTLGLSFGELVTKEEYLRRFGHEKEIVT